MEPHVSGVKKESVGPNKPRHAHDVGYCWGAPTQRQTYMGGCQNCGPFLGTLNIRCRIIIRTQKGTIILRTPYYMLWAVCQAASTSIDSTCTAWQARERLCAPLHRPTSQTVHFAWFVGDILVLWFQIAKKKGTRGPKRGQHA